jgi:hypothetical protein
MDCFYIVTTSARCYLSASSYFVKAYPKTLLIILTLISFQTLGQNYEEMSSDVQFKMDQNKIEGKEILNEIFIDYEFSFGGINTATDKDNLLRVLSEKFNATDINFNSENGHVRFTSPAKNDMDLLKSSLVEVNIGLNNIFRKEYIVSKQ